MSFKRPIWLSALIFITTLLLSLFIRHILLAQERAAQQRQFNNHVTEIVETLQQQLQRYDLVLSSAAALFDSVPNLTRQQWRDFVLRLNLDSNASGVQGLGFAPRLHSDDIATYEQMAQRDGLTQFQVSPKHNEAQHNYFPVYFLEPADWRNLRALGFDMASEDSLLVAMQQAASQNKAVITAPIVLRQETEIDPQHGVIIYWPIYRAFARHDDQSSVAGYLFLALRLNDMMRATLTERLGQFEFDIRDAKTNLPLYQTGTLDREARFTDVRQITYASREWHIRLNSTALFESPLITPLNQYSLFTGVAISALLAILCFALLSAKQRQRWQQQVDTAQLAQREEQFRMLFEGAPNAMLMVNSDGVIERFNAQAEQLFGYRLEEVLGQSIEILLPLRYHYQHRVWRNQFMSQPAARQMGSGRELFALRKDGSEIPVEIGLSPIQTEKGVMTIGSVIDLSARRIAEERARMIVEASPSAIVLVDAEGHIELVNGQTERLFGYTRQELLGESVEILLPEEHRESHIALRAQFIESPSQRRMAGNRELFARHKSGRSIPVEIGLAPMKVAGRQYVKAAIVDITERKAAEQKLREQAEQLALANRYKSEFLANMSHELRTPLNSVLILAEQLRANKDGNLSAKQVTHADVIYRSGSDLLQLINDILDLSKIEAGRMQANFESVSIRDVIRDLIATFQPIADAKDLRLVARISDDIPPFVISDKQRLHQILRNLLSNAVKFTERGSVTIQVENLVVHAQQALLRFDVIDTGIGVAEHDLDIIFSAFRQADGSSNRRYGGTGLGLTIARQLTELLNGNLSVQSTLGQGSVFTLRLPCKVALLLDEQHQDNIVGSTDSAVALLIVEDDPTFAKTVVDVATKYGYTCYVAHSGHHALALLERHHITAIVLDLLLPDINGWQLLRDIRSNVKTRSIPVHIVSCVPAPPYWRSRNIRYFVKPLENAQLEQLINELTQRQSADNRSLLLVEDNAIEADFYSAIFTRSDISVCLVGSGREALALMETQTFDVVVVDLQLPDMSGFDLLETIAKRYTSNSMQIVVNTGLDINAEQIQRLHQFSATVVRKGLDMEQQLLAAVHPFLGGIRLPAPPLQHHAGANGASAKRVLLVDDDVRNIYALIALVEEFGVTVDVAYDGQQALDYVIQHRDVDLILMDMSMPIMDGYQATKTMREQLQLRVPIVALTAHAMPGDREKCLQAGADDYLSKPVNFNDIAGVIRHYLGVQIEVDHD